MRRTNIAELRHRLTQYLQEVRAGKEIIVCDGETPIARIVPFTVDDSEDAALVAAGLMRKGTRKLAASFWKTRRPALPLDAVVAAVGADRGQD